MLGQDFVLLLIMSFDLLPGVDVGLEQGDALIVVKISTFTGNRLSKELTKLCRVPF